MNSGQEFLMSKFASSADLHAAMVHEICRLRDELAARSTPMAGAEPTKPAKTFAQASPYTDSNGLRPPGRLADNQFPPLQGDPPKQGEALSADERDGPTPGYPKTSRDWLAALVDIWDEQETHAPEDRSYVPEALGDAFDQARAHLTSPSPSVEPAPQPVACVSNSNDMEGMVQWATKRIPVGTMLYAAPPLQQVEPGWVEVRDAWTEADASWRAAVVAPKEPKP